MPRKTIGLAIAAALMSALVSVGYPDDRAEETVKSRVHDYMEAWKKNDIETVWDMMSPHLKEGNDNSVTEFRDFVMKQGFHPSDYEIEKITIDDNVATVEAEVHYSDFHGNIFGSEREELKFIEIDGAWYFDNYRVIAP